MRRTKAFRAGIVVAVLGGGLLVAGSLLPWWSTPAEVPLEGTVVPSSIAGTSSDLGWAALLAGVAIVLGALVALILRRRFFGWLVLLGGAVAGAVAYRVLSDPDRWFMDVAAKVAGIEGPEDITQRAHLLGIVAGVQGYPTFEIGLSLVAAGGGLAVVAAIIIALSGRGKAAQPEPTPRPETEVAPDAPIPPELAASAEEPDSAPVPSVPQTESSSSVSHPEPDNPREDQPAPVGEEATVEQEPETRESEEPRKSSLGDEWSF